MSLIPGLHVPGPPASESRFIPNSPWCDHTDHWHSTDGDSTEIEVSRMIAGLVVGLQPETVVETGTAFGQSAQLIGEALRANGHGHLFTLDPDPDRVAYSERRLRDLTAWVTIVPLPSLAWEPPTGHAIDFALFDSLYELRIPEYQRYTERIPVGSLVVFHDTGPERGAHRIESGNDLITELYAELGDYLTILNLRTPRGVVLAQKFR